MEKLDLTETFRQINELTNCDAIYLEKCKFLTSALLRERTTIRDIVQHLGTLLINTSVDKRNLGTLILSEILDRLPNGFLDSTDLYYLATFYSDRMVDHHQIIPAVLKGFAALSKMRNLPEGEAEKLLRALFANVTCQQQPKEDRERIYEIFIELFNTRPAELESMGLDFIFGVIQAIDSERSSTNLLLIFRWIPKLLRGVNLSHLTEEMFLIFECYFPVDFQGAAPDDQTVMRDDLADALCLCLCATPEFAQFCIPLIIEKMRSSLKIAKLDSVKLLTESCRSFHVGIYETHFHDLISCLQEQVFAPSDEELENASLVAITSVIKKLSESDQKSFFNDCLNTCYDSLKGNLRPDTKLYMPTMKLLISIASASTHSCNLVTQKVIRLLTNQFKITEDQLQQEILLRHLVDFVKVHIHENEVTDLSTVELLRETPVVCIEAVLYKKPNVRIAGYVSLSELSKMMPRNTRQNVYDTLRETIFTERSVEVRVELVKCLETFANNYSDEILQLLSSITGFESDLSKLSTYLEIVGTVAWKEPFISGLVPRIVKYCASSDVQVSQVAFHWLRILIENFAGREDLQTFLYKDCEILQVVIEMVTSPSWRENELDFLNEVSVVVRLIVGFQSSGEQQHIVDNYFKKIYSRENGYVEEKFVVVLGGFLLRLRPEIVVENKYDIIRQLVKWTNKSDIVAFEDVCQIIANIINKANEDETFKNTLSEIDGYIKSRLEQNTSDSEINNLIRLLSWITKSLVVKGSDLSSYWTDQLLVLLDSYAEVGICFRLIMDDSLECLSTQCFCLNRMLYRQKFFAYVCKKLSEGHDENKPNYLIALGYLLQLAPQKVLILYFRDIFRLLVLCLEQCKDSEVLCAVLNMLCSLIKAQEPHVESHIDDLMPRFLLLTKFEASMKIRIAALQCIKELSVFPLYKLLPHKQPVILALAQCLDDKKRLVRKQAVETRSTWFLLDSPT